MANVLVLTQNHNDLNGNSNKRVAIRKRIMRKTVIVRVTPQVPINMACMLHFIVFRF